MKTVCVITTSRADYSILRPLLAALTDSSDFDLKLIVGGSHSAGLHGKTLSDIENDPWKPFLVASSKTGGDSSKPGVQLGDFCKFLSSTWSRQPCDWVVLLGDRFEMMAPALAATAANIPILHIAGGDISEGAWDNQIRHALSMLSHMHACSTARSARRILQMGEETWRVHVSGALNLDALNKGTGMDRKEFSKKTGVSPEKPLCLLTFHPETLELSSNAGTQAKIIFEAALTRDLEILATGPNADPGHAEILSELEFFSGRYKNFHLIKNLGPELYPAAMRQASFMLGNSSSGIVEAGYLNLPVIDIGIRQRGREKGPNVIHSACESEAIHQAMDKVLNPDFRRSLDPLNHPYGKGEAAKTILNMLRQAPAASVLLQKKFIESRDVQA